MAEVAAEAREAPYLQQCKRLVEWVIGTLMHLLDPARASLPSRELEDWWWRNPRNIVPRLGLEESVKREWSDQDLHRALHEMDDTGVWLREGDELLPTAFGHDIALLAATLVEQGVIED